MYIIGHVNGECKDILIIVSQTPAVDFGEGGGGFSVGLSLGFWV